MAWAWSRVYAGSWERTLGVRLQRRPVLGPKEVLLVHITPGDPGAWKKRLLGSTIAAALASLMTGAGVRQRQLDVAVLGEVLSPAGSLGGWRSADDTLEQHLRDVKERQGIRRLVMAASSLAGAAGAELARAGAAAGLEFVPVKLLSEDLQALLSLPPPSVGSQGSSGTTSSS